MTARWTAAAGILCWIAFGGAGAGCGEAAESSTQAVARVGTATLTTAQVQAHVPVGLSLDDSATAAQRYVDQWVREQILVAQAEAALPPEAIAFEDEIKAYRNALLLHDFKERYVNERLDGEVSEEEALSLIHI